jgi:hypothetical protein
MTTPPQPAARRPVFTRLAALALALALPACAHAQGEGLVKLLFGALVAGYALVMLVVLLAVRRPRAKALLALALVAGPFLLFVVGGLAAGLGARLGARHQRAIQAEETAQAIRYLEQACATQRVVPAGVATIHGAGGLFMSPTPALSLPEAPSLAPASPAARLAAHLATVWFGTPDSAIRRQRQYGTALDWTAKVFAPTLPPDHGFMFVEEMDAGQLRAIAPHDWWQAHGLARVRDDRRPELLGVLASNHDPRIGWGLDDDQPQARYRLELADISTVEDRRHWVARGRVRILDGRDGKVLAQYVGFSANLESNAVADYGNSWERTLECPGPERAYTIDYGAWRGIDFFFDRFVRLD